MKNISTNQLYIFTARFSDSCTISETSVTGFIRLQADYENFCTHVLNYFQKWVVFNLFFIRFLLTHPTDYNKMLWLSKSHMNN